MNTMRNNLTARPALFCALAAFLASAPGCKKETATEKVCTATRESDEGKDLTIRSSVDSSSFNLSFTSAHTFPGTATTKTITVVDGDAAVLAFSAQTTAEGAIHAEWHFGQGFQGVKEMVVDSADSTSYTAKVDGRATVPFTVSKSASSSVSFTDGQPSPTLSVDDATAKALRDLSAKVKAAPSCGAAAATADASTASTARAEYGGLVGRRTQPFLFGLIDDCDACHLGCAVGFTTELANALAVAAAAAVSGVGAPFVVGTYLATGLGSLKAAFDCDQNCSASAACCPVPCLSKPGGSNALSGRSGECGYSCGAGSVCCGGTDAHPTAQCGDACCGALGMHDGEECMDPNNPNMPVICPAGHGDRCDGADTSGWSGCCDAKTPVCRSVPGWQSSICCATGAGDTCTAGGAYLCCPADAPRCSKNGCCSAADVCGTNGDCCPSPHLCAGDTCCNSGKVCGNACCGQDETCFDASKSLCCGGLGSEVCGSTCCDKYTQACVNGQCCPREQACGTNCCAAGWYCADWNASLCAQDTTKCSPGESVCHPTAPPGQPVTPLCCPAGASCCGVGQHATCCAAGIHQCHSAKEMPPGSNYPTCPSGNPLDRCTKPSDCPNDTFCPGPDELTCRNAVVR